MRLPYGVIIVACFLIFDISQLLMNADEGLFIINCFLWFCEIFIWKFLLVMIGIYIFRVIYRYLCWSNGDKKLFVRFLQGIGCRFFVQMSDVGRRIWFCCRWWNLDLNGIVVARLHFARYYCGYVLLVYEWFPGGLDWTTNLRSMRDVVFFGSLFVALPLGG